MNRLRTQEWWDTTESSSHGRNWTWMIARPAEGQKAMVKYSACVNGLGSAGGITTTSLLEFNGLSKNEIKKKISLIYFHANVEKRAAAEGEIHRFVPSEHAAGCVGSWTQFKLDASVWWWLPFPLTPLLTFPTFTRRSGRLIPGGVSPAWPTQRSLCPRQAVGAINELCSHQGFGEG